MTDITIITPVKNNLAERKLVIRSGFSMALQDSLKDSVRAISVLQKEQRKAAKTIKKLEQPG